MTMLIRRLAAVVTGTVITASAVAQSAQQRARDLLTGVVTHQATIAHNSPIPAVREHLAQGIDPQEQARRIILGTPKVGHVAAPTVAPTLVESPFRNRRAYSDPQELARRMILGAESANTPVQKRSTSAALGMDSPR